MKSLLILLAMATQSPQQFDLICSGRHTIVGVAGKKETPYSMHMRVDLRRRIWCEADCRERINIFAIQPTRIVFEDTVDVNGDHLMHTRHIVDRETGHQVMTADGAAYISYIGDCERRPFTGFPSFDTKF